MTPKRLGQLLEQWVGLELCRQARLLGAGARLAFWRDPDGPEVDWLIVAPDVLIPIEVKWTDAPGDSDIRHLQTFLREYPAAKSGFVVCRTPHRLALAPNVQAISWRDLASIWDGQFDDLSSSRLRPSVGDGGARPGRLT